MAMNERQRKKQEYDSAQKLGERVERMCGEAGWKEHFIPMVQKKRDEAQEAINDLSSDEKTTNFNRGLLKAYDYILGYEEEKKAQARTIMSKTVNRTFSG